MRTTPLEDNTDCSSSGEVKLFSFGIQMQRVEIKVDQETKSVFTPLGFKLPCELKEGDGVKQHH